MFFDDVCSGIENLYTPRPTPHAPNMLSYTHPMIFSRRKNECGKVSNAVRMERWWLLGVFVLAVIGLAFPTGATLALGLSDAINWVLVIFANCLAWVIQMVGNLVVMLVDTLIQIAQYNTFVDAHPVRVGWPLIRDVTNMFFIVILLLIAFSVIIRWSKFNNWKGTLPKFLLMAVLINFSLPLIGILIDFSQVLMLTFVNGFRAAAAGNFVQVLKLDKVLQIANAPIDSGSPFLVQLVAAEMFGIFILGLTCTLMLIMCIYLVVRIVGLWVALILSPLAFFMTAVPSALASKISGIADDYWGKLSSMLTGGPIMAFFLWLTLATVSNGGLGSIVPEGANVRQSEQQQVERYFVSAIGSVEDFGIYLFGIIMMFTGLSTAVSASGKLNSTLGSVTGKIKSGGVWASKMAAYGGALAGGAYAGRVAGKVGGRAGSWVDQRVGVTKGVGNLVRSTGLTLKMPALAAAGTRLRDTRARAVEARGKKYDEQVKDMKLSPEEQVKYAQRIEAGSWSNDKRTAMKERLLKMGTKKEGKDALLKEYEEAAKQSAERAGLKTGEGATDEQKAAYAAHIEAYKKEQFTKKQKERLREYEKTNAGDEDKMKFSKETIEASPSLAKDTYNHVMTEMEKDPNYYRKIRMEEFENPDVLRAIMEHEKVFDEKGEIDKTNTFYKEVMAKGGARANLFKAYAEDVRRAADAKGVNPNELLKDSATLQETGLLSGRYVQTKDRKHYPDGYQHIAAPLLGEVEAQKAPGAGAGSAATPVAGESSAPRRVETPEARNAEGRVASARARVEHVREMPAGPDRDREARDAQVGLREAQASAVAAGARLDRTYEMSGDGAFFSSDDDKHFEEQVAKLHEEAKTDLQAYENVDTEMLMRSPNGDNNARAAFVRQTKVKDLRAAYDRAKQSGDAKTVRRVADMVRIVETEGSKIEALIRAQNARNQKANEAQVKKFGDNAHVVDLIDENKVLQAALSGDEGALKAALGGSGLKISMDNAQALRKKTAIAATTEFVDVKKHATSRGGVAIRSAMRVGGDVAGATTARATRAAAATASTATRAASVATERARTAGGAVAARASSAAASVGARARRVIGREQERDLEARVEEQERKMRSDVEREERRQQQSAAREAQAEARKAAADEASRRRQETYEAKMEARIDAEEERKARGGGPRAT